ncbi:MAG: hypothetical protein OES09_15200 [Gammaproteobacteria bacterium]|nr:hypothetical protein [Gammaproteobacteria bacterium]
MQTLIHSGITSSEVDLDLPETLYYVSNSSIQRGAFLDDSDCAEFLTLLANNFAERSWRCYGYCLVPDGYHLLVKTRAPDLSCGLLAIQDAYARRFRRRYHVVRAHFWGPYRVFFVDKLDFLLPVNRHVMRAPVKMRMVKKVLQWRWSSYGATVGQTQPPIWLDTREILDRFTGLKTMARRRYRTFVEEPAQASILTQARYGIFLGHEAFIHKTLAELSGGRAAVPISRPIRRKSRSRWRNLPR